MQGRHSFFLGHTCNSQKKKVRMKEKFMTFWQSYLYNGLCSMDPRARRIQRGPRSNVLCPVSPACLRQSAVNRVRLSDATGTNFSTSFYTIFSSIMKMFVCFKFAHTVISKLHTLQTEYVNSMSIHHDAPTGIE